MKKLVLLILMPFILGILNVSAQSELNDFEGKTTESQKTRAALLFWFVLSPSFWTGAR